MFYEVAGISYFEGAPLNFGGMQPGECSSAAVCLSSFSQPIYNFHDSCKENSARARARVYVHRFAPLRNEQDTCVVDCDMFLGG